jgi:hypothetical protein
MASAFSQTDTPKIEVDTTCPYTNHRERFGGKVSCWAVDQSHDPLEKQRVGPVRGLYFQKVDSGIVSPMLDNSLFIPVIWTNYATEENPVPTPYQLPDANLDDDNVQDIIIFGTFMGNITRYLMLELSEKGLLESDTENGDNGMLAMTFIVSRQWRGTTFEPYNQIKHRMQADGKWPGSSDLINNMSKFANSIIRGFPREQPDGLLVILKQLIPALNDEWETGDFVTVDSGFSNKTLQEGIAYNLVYGTHEVIQKLDTKAARGRGRRQERGRQPTKRLILYKRHSDRSTSRSPSPASERDLRNDVVSKDHKNDEWAFDAKDKMITHMYQNQTQYRLAGTSHRYFFETHKSDYLYYTRHRATGSGESEMDGHLIARLVVEVTSKARWNTTNIETQLSKSTEQVVQQCLSAISAQQKKIGALLVVPDGLKLVKIERAQDQNAAYVVYETPLIKWRCDNAGDHEHDKLIKLFQELNDLCKSRN